uniref:Secreted protein n=1 Tax=Anguilla anguilla TaxID=7936 RepID=A0A0E9WT33_ANGAN
MTHWCLSREVALVVGPVLLQLVVVHVHSKHLVPVIGAQSAPWLRVVLAIPRDVRTAQGKTCQVHHGHCCSTTNEDEERDQCRVVFELFTDCA